MRRVHRVGTLTLGITLLGLGIAFLLHFFVSAITYQVVLRFWPIVFIILGGEVLLSAVGKEGDRPLVYDKAGIIITMLLLVFAMCMGGLSTVMEYAVKI